MSLGDINLLRFYTNKDLQATNLYYAYNRISPIIIEQNQIPPFQLKRTTSSAAIATFKLIRKVDGTEIDIKDAILDAGFEVVAETDFDLLTYPSIAKLAINPLLDIGVYYLEMSDLATTWYSEHFVMCDNLDDFIKIEYCHTRNFYYKDKSAYVKYANGFRWKVYIDSAISRPDYRNINRVKVKEGKNFPLQQVQYKAYLFKMLAPEYFLDHFRIAALHDIKTITYLGRQYDVDELIMGSPDWKDGFIADVEVEFRTDTIVVNGFATTQTICDVATQNCVDVDTVAESTIFEGQDEWNGNYYLDENGNQALFPAGGYVVGEVFNGMGTGALTLYRWEGPDTYTAQTGIASHIIYSRVKNTFYIGNLAGTGLLRIKITGVTDDGGGLVTVYANGIPDLSHEIWVRDMEGNETLLAIKQPILLTLQHQFTLGDYVEIQIRISSSRCEDFIVTDWAVLPVALDSCDFTIEGIYISDAAAITGGVQTDEYYESAVGHFELTVPGLVKQLNATTVYATDTAADTGGIEDNACYAVAFPNEWAVAQGTIRVLNPTVTYASDAAADTGGIAIGERYALSQGNIYGYAKHFLKVRKS